MKDILFPHKSVSLTICVNCTYLSDAFVCVFDLILKGFLNIL